MRLDVKIEGLDRIAQGTQRARDAIAAEITKGLFDSAKRVERVAKDSIRKGDKTGREYRRGKGVTHRASAPGEPPASDTGRLLNSITGQLAPEPGEATVTARTAYARPLEFGTRKTAARPFLFPALEKSKGWVRERLNRAVRSGVARVVRG